VNPVGSISPTEQVALNTLYLAIMSLDPTGRGRQRWFNRWRAALRAFDITLEGRLQHGTQVRTEEEVTRLVSLTGQGT
jgi:transposase-like protein